MEIRNVGLGPGLVRAARETQRERPWFAPGLCKQPLIAAAWLAAACASSHAPSSVSPPRDFAPPLADDFEALDESDNELHLYPRTDSSMTKLVYGLSQSLDGYVDHVKLGPPVPAAFRHFVEQMRRAAGLIYGRGLYEIMRGRRSTSPAI
jgi:hypothetical protein